MKQGLNPLFPKSDGKGLKGAYEYAALIDDEATTYGTKQKRQINSHLKIQPAVGTTYKEFNGNYKEIMANYFAELKNLKRQKRAGEITGKEFRQARKILANGTNALLRGNLSDFALGTAQTPRETAREGVSTQPAQPQPARPNINLNKLEF